MSAAHLPKMDVAGSCDAYVVVALEEQERKTSVVKDTYSPVWGESLFFTVEDAGAPVGDLRAEVPTYKHETRSGTDETRDTRHVTRDTRRETRDT